MLVRRVSRSYYSADGKLRVHESQRDSVELWVGGQTRGRRGVFEEYWYDALGRRILKRARADSLCPLAQNVGHFQEYIERYMWDGDQLLHEVRLQETDDNASVTQMNLTNPSANAQSGKITYTHSGSIDQPLDLVRIGLDGVVIPQVTWRGQYDAATDTLGAGISVDWPGDEPYSYYNPLEEAPQKWYGSLVLGQRDASGLTYMRNRYYDPVSGQFTQQDPIGISGGLNVYGFTGGDPVNFSDPFGLCRNGATDDGDNEYSICVGDRDLNPEGYVISNPLVRQAVADLYSGILAKTLDDDFEFEVTGGDRYVDANGLHRSSTNDDVVVGSASNSPHLTGNGARAVDLRIRGVSDGIVDFALRRNTAFLPANTIRGYADGHTHVALPNSPAYYQ